MVPAGPAVAAAHCRLAFFIVSHHDIYFPVEVLQSQHKSLQLL